MIVRIPKGAPYWWHDTRGARGSTMIEHACKLRVEYTLAFPQNIVCWWNKQLDCTCFMKVENSIRMPQLYYNFRGAW